MADDKLVTHLVLSGMGTYMRGLSRVEYGLNAGAKAADDFRMRTERISEAANAASAVGTKMAMAGGAIVLGLGAAAKVAADFDKQMRNVNSIARLSEVEFQKLRDDVLALAADPHIIDGPTKLAEGLYQIQSSGFSGALGLKVLEVAAKGGAAGMSDTFTAASALAGIMNAYNQKTGPDAERIMDTLFKTVELGVVTFEELAQTIGPVAAIAAQAGVPLEQVAAATTVMTKRGIDAAMTMTSLQRIMTAFLDTPPQMAEAMKQYTDESGASILRTKGLVGAIEILSKIAGDNPEVLAQIGLEARALRGALSLTADGAQDLAKDLAGIKDAAGAYGAAGAEQAKSQAYGWEVLRKTLEIVAVALGDIAAGPMNEVAQKLAAFLQSISKLPYWLKATVVYLVGGGGLVALFAGLAIKLAATVVQTWLGISAAIAYVGALRAETLAATQAAAANTALAGARTAAAGAGVAAGAGGVAAGAGGVAGVAAGAGAAAGLGVGVGAMALPLALFAGGAAAGGLAAWAMWKMLLPADWQEQIAATRAAAGLGVRAGGEIKGTPNLASGELKRLTPEQVRLTAEKQRLAALAELALAYEGLGHNVELFAAMENAGTATAAQVYAARQALIENMIAQWDQMTQAEKESEAGRKLHLGALALAADQINAKEEYRKGVLEDQLRAIEAQTKAMQDQLGLLDAQVGYAQAYAEYLEAIGRPGLARQYEREVVGPMQARAAWEQMGVARQYMGMGMHTQGLQVGAQALRSAGEAWQSTRGGQGQGRGGDSKIVISPNWSFERMQRDQDETVYLKSAAGM